MTKQSFYKQNDDEEYRPTRPSKNGSRKKKTQVVQNEMKNSSKWTHEQNSRFLEFVKSNKEMLACPLKRKEQRVFLQLSRFIVTRTPDQCRSHHQKMIKHHNDLEGIIQNLERRLSNSASTAQISQNIEIQNEIVQKKEKVEQNQFFDIKIGIEMESFEIGEKDLWGFLDEQIWIERPIELLMEY